MTGKAEIQNKQVVGLHNTTEPMNAYFVIITGPLRVFMGLKEKVVLSSTIIHSFTCQWECKSRSQLLPSRLQEKPLGTGVPRSWFPPRRQGGPIQGTIMLESFFPKIWIHRYLLCYLKLPQGRKRPNLAILFVVNCKTLPSQHLAKASFGAIWQ